MTQHIRPAIVMLLIFTLLLGAAYPLAVTGLSRLMFSAQAGGSLVEKEGRLVGSSLIGQSFTQDKYFHGRPSATTMTDPDDATKSMPSPYKADSSSGSNAGPTSKALIDRVTQDAADLKHSNPDMVVPIGLATTSASGLDPDISPADAEFQAARVAHARGTSVEAVIDLIGRHTRGRLFEVFGEPTVNVLMLNLALDSDSGLTAQKPQP